MEEKENQKQNQSQTNPEISPYMEGGNLPTFLEIHESLKKLLDPKEGIWPEIEKAKNEIKNARDDFERLKNSAQEYEEKIDLRVAEFQTVVKSGLALMQEKFKRFEGIAARAEENVESNRKRLEELEKLLNGITPEQLRDLEKIHSKITSGLDEVWIYAVRLLGAGIAITLLELIASPFSSLFLLIKDFLGL